MKRLLLLSSLIFGLALSGCGNGNNNGDDNGGGTGKDTPQKATLGQDCTKTKECASGLACVLASGQTDKGKCETACNANDACSDNTKQCKTDVAGLEGKTVKVCREKSTVTPPDPQKKELGQPCTEPTECKENLVCVADAGKTDKGKCQTACPQNTCTDGTLTCQNVDGLNNSKVDACLTPPPVERKEGEECREKENCEDGTICLAKLASETVGVCTKTKECTQKADCGTDECLEERILGGKTLNVCLPEWCTNSDDCDESKNEYCAASPADLTRGHCKVACNPTLNTGCNAGMKCIFDDLHRSRGSSNNVNPGICIDEKIKDGAGLAYQDCDDTTPCGDPRLACVQGRCTVPCDEPGFQTQCIFGYPTFEWCMPGLDETKFPNKMFCGPIWFAPEEWKTAKKGESCGKTQMCDLNQDLRCLLDNEGASTGTCVEIDESKRCGSDKDCAKIGGTCKELYGPHLLLGAARFIEDYFEYGIKTCQK